MAELAPIRLINSAPRREHLWRLLGGSNSAGRVSASQADGPTRSLCRRMPPASDTRRRGPHCWRSVHTAGDAPRGRQARRPPSWRSCPSRASRTPRRPPFLLSPLNHHPNRVGHAYLRTHLVAEVRGPPGHRRNATALRCPSGFCGEPPSPTCLDDAARSRTPQIRSSDVAIDDGGWRHRERRRARLPGARAAPTCRRPSDSRATGRSLVPGEMSQWAAAD